MDGDKQWVHLENSLDLTHAHHMTLTALVMFADLQQTYKYELRPAPPDTERQMQVMEYV